VHAAIHTSAVGSKNILYLYMPGGWGQVQEVLDPVDVVGPVGHRRTQLAVRNPPRDAVVVVEEHFSQLPRCIEVGPAWQTQVSRLENPESNAFLRKGNRLSDKIKD
jgi:hypothetical protein